MLNKKTIKDIKIAGDTVLVRVDYNVPLSEDGKITSDLRIRASLPTIEYLLTHKAKKIVLISHLGRPESRDKALSLRSVAEVLAGLLPGHNVNFVDDVSGPEVEAAVKSLPEGGILLLENLRFGTGEEKNSDTYAQEIVDSTHATLFVQDGFAVSHRAHASTDAITHLIPSVAGLLLEKEISTLAKVRDNPEHPLLVIIGGSKVEDKEPLISAFSAIADHIAVGGKIAADAANAIAAIATKADNTAAGNAPVATVYLANDFDEDSEGHKLDIGPVSTGHIVELIKSAKTVIWNGLLGKAEDPAFATSSTIVAKILGEDQAITSVICGGDTTGFVEELQSEDPSLHYTLVSTGGGAALEFLCGRPMPGYDNLEDSDAR